MEQGQKRLVEEYVRRAYQKTVLLVPGIPAAGGKG